MALSASLILFTIIKAKVFVISACGHFLAEQIANPPICPTQQTTNTTHHNKMISPAYDTFRTINLTEIKQIIWMHWWYVILSRPWSSNYTHGQTTAQEEEEEEEANSGYAFTIALNTVFSSAFIEELYTICYHEQTTSEEVIQVFTHLLPFLLFKYALKVT